MQATLNYTVNGTEQTLVRELPDAERGFWHEVSSLLGVVDIPSRLGVSTPCGDAALDITERGTYVKNGEDVPSMFVIPLYNDISLNPSDYDDAYLTCINPDSKGGRGNYKFYRLSQLADGNVTAFYGRIGQRHGFGAEREIKEPMPSWMFEVRKAEKIAKGYVDRSDAYCDGEKHVVASKHLDRACGNGLYAKLLAFAKNRVADSLAVGTIVTSKQVDECDRLLKRLGRCRKVTSFNERLLELMTLSPRNVGYVQTEMARSEGDFKRIIDREDSLLAAMRAVADAGGQKPSQSDGDGFAKKGITYRVLSDQEKKQVEKHVPASLRGQIVNVYEIKPESQHAKFEDYLSKRNLGSDDVRLMWHGSRNENWCSIVSHSLMLNPNAQITGKMFGYGIYFGYDEVGGGALKSWNYTSARGSYWAHGSSNTAFMGLYECAYGKPHHPRRAGSFDKKWLDANGFDCVHARGGDCGLYHDEVVFYDEAAICIKYLFEFAV